MRHCHRCRDFARSAAQRPIKTGLASLSTVGGRKRWACSLNKDRGATAAATHRNPKRTQLTQTRTAKSSRDTPDAAPEIARYDQSRRTPLYSNRPRHRVLATMQPMISASAQRPRNPVPYVPAHLAAPAVALSHDGGGISAVQCCFIDRNKSDKQKGSED